MQRTSIVALSLPLILSTACSRDNAGSVRTIEAELPTADTATGIVPVEQVRKSQAAAIAQRIANTEVMVTYSRPVARGRELFGALVPFGKVWNPGADSATAIRVSRDVEIEGQSLPAGLYSIWAIPDADRWTIIFSRAAPVYHTPYPGEDQDALRVNVRPEQGEHMETLAFDFPVVDGKDAVLRLHWGRVVVPMRLRVP